MSFRGLCPDGGTCHENLPCRVDTVTDKRCSRVRHSGPLSGAFADNRWPDEVLDANEVAHGLVSGEGVYPPAARRMHPVESRIREEVRKWRGDPGYRRSVRLGSTAERGNGGCEPLVHTGEITNEIHLPNSGTVTVRRYAIEVHAKDLIVGDWLMPVDNFVVAGGQLVDADGGNIAPIEAVEHGIENGRGVAVTIRGKVQAIPVNAWCKVLRIDPREPGDYREPECVRAWPECHNGDYNPSCCRWPKSCSC